MLPFIVALVFAVGIPLLPSSFHRALHLPTLKFNFLSARHAPEQVLVSSPETTLLLETSYPEVSPDSGGSSQYLTFPDIPSADCSKDAAAPPIYMSLTEKQDYPQPSIWNVIRVQLLYQLAEATIIMALSFFATATFLSRCCLSTLLERLCTAVFISRQYSPKAALSSFLQDVFYRLHQYWMDDTISKGETRDPVPDHSQQEALEVFASIVPEENCEIGTSVPSLMSASNLQDNLMPLDSGSSFSTSIPLPSSTKTSSAIDPARTFFLDNSTRPLCSNANVSEKERPQLSLESPVQRCPPCATQPTIISETKNRYSDITNDETSPQSRISLSCTVETSRPDTNACFPVVSSPPNSSTASLPFISMEDLYKSSRLNVATILPEPPRRAQENCVSEPSRYSHPSSGRETLGSVNVTPPNLEFERFQYESRRRYKSDGIQVRAAHCHPADTAALLALPAPSPLPRSLPKPRIRRDTSEQGENGLSADAALVGFVVTGDGEMIVPASQRPDGSMRREIRLRPGHALSESFTEKYLPPAARRRTTTWNPLLREYSASSPSSPHRPDSPLPSTPRGIRQRLLVPHTNSPASQSDNWRQSNSAFTAQGTPPTTAVTLPSMGEAKSSPATAETNGRVGNLAQEASRLECSVLLNTDAITYPAATITTAGQVTLRAVEQNAPVQAVNRPSSPPATMDPSTEKETASVKEGAEATEATRSVSATDNDWDSQQEAPSATPTTPTNTGMEGRRPLRDITFSFSAPGLKGVEYLAGPPPETAQTHTILSQVLDKYLLQTPTRISEDANRAIRETTLNSPRKRKPSAEPHESCSVPVFQGSDDALTPHRRPRARRSAPHLGRYATSKQQAKTPRSTETPEGSKRRRMRTASSRGVENWAVALAAPRMGHNGQIVLPAGTGWKGRSSAAGQPPQRQRQPTAVLA